MLQYTCDWCGKLRSRGSRWILGLAADRVGSKVRRRELEILKCWTPFWANHPLAVHFCSPEHRDNYTRALFRSEHTTAQRTNARSASTGLSVSAQVSIGAQPASTTRKRRTATKTAGPTLNAAEPPGKPATSPRRRTFSRSDKLRAHGLGIKL